jgi:hypothetical protein
VFVFGLIFFSFHERATFASRSPTYNPPGDRAVANPHGSRSSWARSTLGDCASMGTVSAPPPSTPRALILMVPLAPIGISVGLTLLNHTSNELCQSAYQNIHLS